ncbi:hypothetical protein RRU01S_15_00680 [Agrobacterium rubi TR3 = NBRC 13261]|uniref:Replication protein n=1 Tax=Agrobacterium rubi TR3 = NBRC 13261 TaxID=1368415 RepID=A0A081CWU7_9HYPH|nr:hypothetical protein [Agrobacterium rubi]MBP1878110.1 hypothetical protein [Agrobacterium rubi]GAK71143.1 hypothetical protein RRU01S_15_00680 [Agrobacterium rubi TR3 = NBRC 13261]
MSSNPSHYSGQSPLFRRLINGPLEGEETRKIATKSDDDKTSEPLAEQGFERDSSDARLVAPQQTSTTLKKPTNEDTSTPLKAPLTDQAETPLPATPKAAKPKKQAPKKWRNLSDIEKLTEAHITAESLGALAFTINFSDRLQKTLSAFSDPTRLISGYIGRELRKALGHSLPHVFTIEVSRSGKLHAHGAVVIGDDLREERIASIDKALGRAGGKLKAARIVCQTQSYLDHLHNGEGWAKYLAKSRSATCKHLGTDKISFISTDLLRLARFSME